jgi:hypothetical protein
MLTQIPVINLCHPEARFCAEGPMQLTESIGAVDKLHRSFASLRMTRKNDKENGDNERSLRQ